MSPVLAAELVLSERWPAPPAPLAAVSADWAGLIGAESVLLVRSVAAARHALLCALAAVGDGPIAVPANASRELVEAVKLAGGAPHFEPFGDAAAPRAATVVTWWETVGGLPLGLAAAARLLIVDDAATLPVPAAATVMAPTGRRPAFRLWGLHLASEPVADGALLALTDPDDALAQRVWRHLTATVAAAAPAPGRARAQLERLQGRSGQPGLAADQQTVLAETARGVAAAAGLPVATLSTAAGLAHQVAVRIPDECDAATFYAYVVGEQTPAAWLPLVRPLHHAAIASGPARQALAASAAELTRWVLLPVGPEQSAEEISHAVLGIVKAAEYLGVRWRTAPARAADYAALLTAAYGPNHDAYRPVFPVPVADGRR